MTSPTITAKNSYTTSRDLTPTLPDLTRDHTKTQPHVRRSDDGGHAASRSSSEGTERLNAPSASGALTRCCPLAVDRRRPTPRLGAGRGASARQEPPEPRSLVATFRPPRADGSRNHAFARISTMARPGREPGTPRSSGTEPTMARDPETPANRRHRLVFRGPLDLRKFRYFRRGLGNDLLAVAYIGSRVPSRNGRSNGAESRIARRLSSRNVIAHMVPSTGQDR